MGLHLAGNLPTPMEGASGLILKESSTRFARADSSVRACGHDSADLKLTDSHPDLVGAVRHGVAAPAPEGIRLWRRSRRTERRRS